ncbi:hypothetical protein K438DRAFT_1768539 [Mycena galopus ATCC 62051]|nr:hypothetical protein K438DRAFT_1768539 [Mycena galopus ATCC 62051]
MQTRHVHTRLCPAHALPLALLSVLLLFHHRVPADRRRVERFESELDYAVHGVLNTKPEPDTKGTEQDEWASEWTEEGTRTLRAIAVTTALSVLVVGEARWGSVQSPPTEIWPAKRLDPTIESVGEERIAWEKHRGDGVLLSTSSLPTSLSVFFWLLAVFVLCFPALLHSFVPSHVLCARHGRTDAASSGKEWRWPYRSLRRWAFSVRRSVPERSRRRRGGSMSERREAEGIGRGGVGRVLVHRRRRRGVDATKMAGGGRDSRARACSNATLVRGGGGVVGVAWASSGRAGAQWQQEPTGTASGIRRGSGSALLLSTHDAFAASVIRMVLQLQEGAADGKARAAGMHTCKCGGPRMAPRAGDSLVLHPVEVSDRRTWKESYAQCGGWYRGQAAGGAGGMPMGTRGVGVRAHTNEIVGAARRTVMRSFFAFTFTFTFASFLDRYLVLRRASYQECCGGWCDARVVIRRGGDGDAIASGPLAFSGGRERDICPGLASPHLLAPITFLISLLPLYFLLAFLINHRPTHTKPPTRTSCARSTRPLSTRARNLHGWGGQCSWHSGDVGVEGYGEAASACLRLALPLLNELNDAFGPPFIQSISNTIEALLDLVKNVKRNKDDCAQLMDNIHQVLWGIIKLHIKSETPESLSPSMMDNIGNFTETLHKIYNFIEAKQEGSKIKHLFRNRLGQAMEVFKFQAGAETLNDIRELKSKADLMHRELIELIETLSDTGTLSETSSVYRTGNESKNSSNSFSMLPSKPKIFHGREQELDSVLKLLSQQSPRIAILGGGGMGKTSLAKAVLHHQDTSLKFEHRFFVSAEAATTSIELAALVGLHVGLNPGQDLTKPVVQYFARKQSCLLILDNLETVWEPIQSQNGVEEFLSLLSEVEHLALIITMRGAERPAKVQWTHPFLLPLQPLSDDAAKQTFMDITDNSNTSEEVNQLLQFTDNMPLAVDLIAHLADYEGFSNVLAQWEMEKTSLLSVGFDRQSSLEASIGLSLASPRITSGSKQLLSLLSILPNGLSEAELVQSQLGISNILSCKAALQATSLIYQDGNKRFLLLMPVREYIQHFMPVSKSHIQAIRKHFYALFALWRKHQGQQSQPIVIQMTLNLANLHEVLKRGLDPSAETLADTICCVIFLNAFCRMTGHGHTLLMDHIQPVISGAHDHQLTTLYFVQVLLTPKYWVLMSEETIAQTISQLDHSKDPLLASQFYEAAGTYFFYNAFPQKATQFYQRALALSQLCEANDQQCEILLAMTYLESNSSNYVAAKTIASTAQTLSKRTGDLHLEASATLVSGTLSMHLGQYQEGTAKLNKARELLKMAGFEGGRIDHAITLAQADIHRLKSEYAQAKQIYNEAVKITAAAQDDRPHAYALLNSVMIETMIDGPREDVYRSLDIVRANAKFNSIGEIIVHCDIGQGIMELQEKKFDTAYDRLCQCLMLTWSTRHESTFLALQQLANIKAWPASKSQQKWPLIYLGCAYKARDKWALHKALLFLGDVFIANEDETTATNLYQVALTGFTHMDVHHNRALCILRLGDLAKRQGRTTEAITLWKAARPLFVQSSQVQDVADIDDRIQTAEENHQKVLSQLETLHTPTQPMTLSGVNTEDPDNDTGKHVVITV